MINEYSSTNVLQRKSPKTCILLLKCHFISHCLAKYLHVLFQSVKRQNQKFFIDKQKLVIIRYGKRTWLLHLIYEISTEITILEVNRNGGT